MTRAPISGARRMRGKISSKQADEFDAIALAIIHDAKPLFAGKPPEAQGAALGELMATFLLGYHVIGNPSGQTACRQDVFETWCGLVAELMSHYEENEEEPTIQ